MVIRSRRFRIEEEEEKDEDDDANAGDASGGWWWLQCGWREVSATVLVLFSSLL